jgi:hypothetical protein
LGAKVTAPQSASILVVSDKIIALILPEGAQVIVQPIVIELFELGINA